MINMYIIKKFLTGEGDENEFYDSVNEAFQEIRQRFKEYGSSYKEENGKISSNAESYINSASEDLESIKSAEKNEPILREAAICDMCNNLAHASKLIKDNDARTTASFFSLKIDMIKQITKECEMQGNRCYGKGYDLKKKCETFIVDIPMCGQISWHLGGQTVSCKQYDFEKDKTDYKNCALLNRKVKYSDIKRLPTHTQKVLLAMDNEEMAESLYGGESPTVTVHG